MIEQLWRSPGKSYNLHIFPRNPAPKSGTDGLHSRFLSGKAGRQTFGRIYFAGAVANLLLSKNPMKKALTVAFKGLPDSWYLSDINSGSYDHVEGLR